MTEQAKEARRAYKRQWVKNNPDKIKKYQMTYWNKKAVMLAAQEAQEVHEV